MRKSLGNWRRIAGPLLRAATLFLLISSAFSYAQTYTCPPAPARGEASIDSISPTTLIAGQTTILTINGSYCAAIIFAQPPLVSMVSLYDADPRPENQGKFEVTVDAAEPTQTAIVIASGYDWECYSNGLPCPYASVPIQIVAACPTPTITSISPSTWFAGKTYDNVVIKGTNFITSEKATATCPMTQVTATTPDGSVVTVSNINVESKAKITATIAPDANTTTEQATVTAANGPDMGTYSGQPPAQILGNQIQCDSNMSNCGGTTISVIDGTGSIPTTQAVVGQQIILKSLPLPNGISATKTTWKIGGAKIAGYNPSTGATDVSPFQDTSLNGPNINFYWVKQKTSIPVTYEYCVDIQGAKPVNQCSKADAQFDVNGPKSAHVYRCGGAVGAEGCTSNSKLGKVAIGPRTDLGTGTYLSFGGTAGTNLGIVFTSSDDASSPQGTYSFVQLINTYNWTYSYTNGQSCPAGETVGLDNKYPVPMDTPTTVEDSPAVKIFSSDDTEVTASFNATMYALWTPSNVNGAIPVPIGNITWGWDGDAVQTMPASTTPQNSVESALSPTDSSQETVLEDAESVVPNAIQPDASKTGWGFKKGSTHKGYAGELDTKSAAPTWGYPTWSGLATVTNEECFK